MIDIDLVWVLAWFGVGLVTFQVRGIKHTFAAISFIFSFLSLFLLISEQNPVGEFLNWIGLDFISGLFTSLSYLIGANISRYEQFGNMSPRIFYYTFFFFMLWLALEALF